MMRALAVASVLLGGCHAFGQSPEKPAARRPEFEVASIKPNKSASFGMLRPGPGGHFSAADIPFQLLITFAYNIKDFQLSGAPPWLLSERYDIEAKAEGDPGFDGMRLLLQTLFEDRLQFKFHRETKDLPIYALVVAKAGKLHPAEGECGPPPSGPPPPPQPGKLPTAFCGGFMMFPGHLSGQKVTIEQFLDPLSRFTGRTVLDKTNLTGKYDIDVQYTPEQGQFQSLPGGAPPGGALPGTPTLAPIDPNGPSLFTALQDQLGLRLESQKGPVEMIVIDHIERPSEN